MNRITFNTFLLTILIWSGLQATAQARFEVIEEAGTVLVPGYGPIPKEILWNDDKSVMVLIPGGTYTIGRPRTFEDNTDNNEIPEVTVTISPFYINKYEITNKQYNAVSKAAGLSLPQSISNPVLLKENHPVMGINFDSALGYAKKVARDLPTEAEWEIAARGAQGTMYPWGDSPDNEALHFNVGSAVGSKPVGSMPRDVSSFGVYDMAGNVSEWTKDNYARNYYDQVKGQTDPVVTSGGSSKSIRGSSYKRTRNQDGRLTYRNSVVPIYSREEVGFRTVFRIEPPRPTPTPTPIPPTPTPTPDPKLKVDQMKRLLEDYFLDTTVPVPAQYVRLGSGGPGKACAFFNQSPFELRLGFVDAENQYIYRFPTTVDPFSVLQVNIPTGITLNLFAYAPNAPYQEVVDLGKFSSDAQPMMIIPSDAFTSVLSSNDKFLQPVPNRKALQYYTNLYRPDWHVLEFFNDTDLPIELTLSIKMPGGGLKSSTRTLGENEVARFDDFPGGNLNFTVNYLGGDEKRKVSTDFRNDQKRDRQFFRLVQDTIDEAEAYTDLSQKVYPIRPVKVEFRFSDNLKNIYFAK